MDSSFIVYIQKLELIAFFSGYPVIYAIFLFVDAEHTFHFFKKSLLSFLPLAYALMGTFFLGLQLKKLYPHYTFQTITQTNALPYLTVWGLLSLLFWLPAFSKKSWLALLHSFIFFLLLLQDFFPQLITPYSNNDNLNNEMKMYIFSLLLNLGAVAVVMLTYFVYFWPAKRRAL
jgi:hypothetical protein